MSNIQQENKGSTSPLPETKMTDQSDSDEGIPLSSSSHENDNHKDLMERGDFRPVNYMDAILEIILEILINSSIVNILAHLFPAVRNSVVVGLIVTLVIVLMEVFQILEKIQKPPAFLKKKLGIYSFLILGSAFLLADAIDKVDNFGKMTLMTITQFHSSCPATPNPFLVHKSIQHTFQSSLSPVPFPNAFTSTSTPEPSEVDLIIHYVLSLSLLFLTFFKASVLVFKVGFDELLVSE